MADVNTSKVRESALTALERHRRDPDQRDVWLPSVRCLCGDVMPSNRLRGHIADEIATAVTSHLGDGATAPTHEQS